MRGRIGRSRSGGGSRFHRFEAFAGSRQPLDRIPDTAAWRWSGIERGGPLQGSARGIGSVPSSGLQVVTAVRRRPSYCRLVPRSSDVLHRGGSSLCRVTPTWSERRQTLAVDAAAHRLHVLLRHRLLRQPHGCEGLLAVHGLDHSGGPAVAHGPDVRHFHVGSERRFRPCGRRSGPTQRLGWRLPCRPGPQCRGPASYQLANCRLIASIRR